MRSGYESIGSMKTLEQARDFINDQQEGLPSFINRIKNRPARSTP